MKYGLALALLVASVPVASDASEFGPTYLRCEYRADPLGIDVERPRLSWIVSPGDAESGRTQRAFSSALTPAALDLALPVNIRFFCVSNAPLGFPVVPEV